MQFSWASSVVLGPLEFKCYWNLRWYWYILVHFYDLAISIWTSLPKFLLIISGVKWPGSVAYMYGSSSVQDILLGVKYHANPTGASWSPEAPAEGQGVTLGHHQWLWVPTPLIGTVSMVQSRTHSTKWGYLFSDERDHSVDCEEWSLPSCDDNTKVDIYIKQLHLPLELKVSEIPSRDYLCEFKF